ncbi:MAG TPA: carboxypeptidase-like regulatory domain-containing protein, partial [Dongiaceae bacterium]|nr:carboxypeptidase-like regulatory domain-containing protein [Dongiaceae bacterium]
MKKLIAFSASLLRMCLLVGLREIWEFGAAVAFRLHWFETEVVTRLALSKPGQQNTPDISGRMYEFCHAKENAIVNLEMDTKGAPMWSFQRIVLSLLLVAGSSVSLFAQSDTARLQGTITDAQGAAIKGATITVTSKETGRPSTVASNDLGYYSVSALPAGNYHVEVSQKGFKKVTRDLELQVAQLGVADFQLEVGEVTETVNVTAGSPVIDVQDSAIGEVVEARQIEEMPLNGRNFTQLALLVPGVVRGSGNATGSSGNAETFRYGQEGGASLVVNGIRAQANNFILDGIDNNEALVNTIVIFPPADAIEEFRVQTNIAPAEFGRAGG